MRDRTYAPQRRRGHAHVWHRIARLPYARPYAQKGIRPGDTTGIARGTWDHPGTLGPQEIIFSVQLYAPPNLCASKIAAHVIHKMHHFATVCAGTLCARIAVRSLYQITLCTNCMRRQNPMRRDGGVLAGGHIYIYIYYCGPVDIHRHKLSISDPK